MDDDERTINSDAEDDLPNEAVTAKHDPRPRFYLLKPTVYKRYILAVILHVHMTICTAIRTQSKTSN